LTNKKVEIKKSTKKLIVIIKFEDTEEDADMPAEPLGKPPVIHVPNATPPSEKKVDLSS
jgi:hypothetical protein